MALVLESMGSHPHTHLSSDLSIPHSADHLTRDETPMNQELLRSASFTALPALKSSSYGPEKTLLRGFSLDDLSIPSPTKGVNFNGALRQPSRNNEEQKIMERLGRRKSLMTRPKSWIQQVKGSQERRDSPERNNSTNTEVAPAPPIPTMARNKSKSFVSYARRSWMSSSRSPSPNKARSKDSARSSQEDESTPPSSISSSSPRTSSALPHAMESEKKHLATRISKSPVRKAASFLQKKRPRSAIFSSNLKSAESSLISINRLSPERRASPQGSLEKLPVMPKGIDMDKPAESPRRRDELWSAFRALETDFSKFQAKTSVTKSNAVRATLLPFLKTYAQHPSNKTLRPEDLDRRVSILNKWWTGILEMLEGRNSQMVSGIDRPVLLEAVTLIMTRPEWRLPPSQFAPLSDRCFGTESRNTSSGSLNSSAAQFLAESVYHNVRNMFIQNLLSQMHLVVDKMSMRQTPASLVTFCGKAAAYAFFFCPGVADVLIKVWELSAPTLRRVIDEFGLSRRSSKNDFSEDLTTTFPSNLHSLAWVSLATTMKQLRRPANLPLGASKIPWFGPWVSRWRGRDSDLFFVFCKHYHILAEDFMPIHLPFFEKVRAPGFVLVHTQILTVIDGTIHRQSSPDQFVSGPLPITFDDVLAGAEASAAILPLPSNNASRLMAENRLIMLLRDFLSDKSSEFDVARRTFAEAFSMMARGAAKRTSQYDNGSCLTLCDFLEEALSIYLRFQGETSSRVDYIDWGFWLAVCKKMLDSQNIMTEIRLFSFIYGSWNILVSDSGRKEVICLDWLLAPDTFERHFCHWCPMVRAYFMRLLCWRASRFEGEASALDTKIYKTLLDRLKATWVQYTSLRHEAEMSSKPSPSTAPCYPAPGRRLLIVRNDNHPPSNLFLGFDGVVAPSQIHSSITQPTTYKRTSLASLTRLQTGENLSPTDDAAPLSNSSGTSTAAKKRWNGLIERIISFGSPEADSSVNQIPATQSHLQPLPLFSPPNTTPQASLLPPTSFHSSPSKSATTPISIIRSPSKSKAIPTSTSESLAAARYETSLRRSGSRAVAGNRKGTHSSNSSTDSVVSLRGVCTFKFSLEWANNASNNGVGNNGGYGKERRLWDPKLPAPAQGYLNSRGMGISGVGINLGGGYSVGGVARKETKDVRMGGMENTATDGTVSSKGEKPGNKAVYAGRALSEWALAVQECNNFGDRRRTEGVGGWKWIEVPMLGVEGFRKYG